MTTYRVFRRSPDNYINATAGTWFNPNGGHGTLDGERITFVILLETSNWDEARALITQARIDVFYETHPEFLAAATVEQQEQLPQELRDELAYLYRASEYAAAGPVRVSPIDVAASVAIAERGTAWLDEKVPGWMERIQH